VRRSWRLPDVVDANVVKVLEQLKNHSVQHQSLTLDTSGVREIDLVGAELLLRVLNAFKRASHELMVLGRRPADYAVACRCRAGPPRPEAMRWMLLLEVFRLLKPPARL